jgi:hypothetical protein
LLLAALDCSTLVQAADRVFFETDAFSTRENPCQLIREETVGSDTHKDLDYLA